MVVIKFLSSLIMGTLVFFAFYWLLKNKIEKFKDEKNKAYLLIASITCALIVLIIPFIL